MRIVQNKWPASTSRFVRVENTQEMKEKRAAGWTCIVAAATDEHLTLGNIDWHIGAFVIADGCTRSASVQLWRDSHHMLQALSL